MQQSLFRGHLCEKFILNSCTLAGPLDAVPNVTFTKVDDCCSRILWNEPYSLAGVPILGYNVTSTDLNIDRYVTWSMDAIVCSTRLQQHNTTVIIQGYNGLDGDAAIINLDFDIGKCIPIVVRKNSIGFHAMHLLNIYRCTASNRNWKRTAYEWRRSLESSNYLCKSKLIYK